MVKIKLHNFNDLLNDELKNEKFAKEYHSLEKEYSLAREIIQLRKEQNLTQAELAKLAHTSQPAIARLESGNYKNFSLSFIRRVARALNTMPEIHLKRTL